MMTESRSAPSILINNDLLLDCGEGCTQKLLQLQTLDTINTICITHLHMDHYWGLFPLLIQYQFSNRTADLTIIGPPQHKATLEKILALVVGWSDFGRLNFNIHFKELTERDGVQEIIGDYIVTCAKMDHTIISFAYRVEKNNQSVCYSGDTSPTQQLVQLAENSDVFICEATFPDKLVQLAEKHGHSTISDAVKMARDANCQKLALTHLLPLFAKNMIESKNKLKEMFDKEIVFADDLLTIEIDYTRA
jgi:ribonuclease Z